MTDASKAELTAEVDELRHQLKEKELEIDKMADIQQTLLPDNPPEIRGFDVACSHIAPEKAGGDYYDFIPGKLRSDLSPEADTNWLMMVADVSGHGPAASVIMAMVHSVLHAYDGARQNPGEVMSYINEQLCKKELEHFVTAMLVVLDPDASAVGRFAIAIAGHHPPLVRRTDGTVEELSCESGLPLAVDDGATYGQSEFMLQSGESMLIYTDGLIEPLNAADDEFGLDGLTKAFSVCGGGATDAIERINRSLMIHRGSEEQPDDKTVIVIVKD